MPPRLFTHGSNMSTQGTKSPRSDSSWNLRSMELSFQWATESLLLTTKRKQPKNSLSIHGRSYWTGRAFWLTFEHVCLCKTQVSHVSLSSENVLQYCIILPHQGVLWFLSPMNSSIFRGYTVPNSVRDVLWHTPSPQLYCVFRSAITADILASVHHTPWF